MASGKKNEDNSSKMKKMKKRKKKRGMKKKKNLLPRYLDKEQTALKQKKVWMTQRKRKKQLMERKKKKVRRKQMKLKRLWRSKPDPRDHKRQLQQPQGFSKVLWQAPQRSPLPSYHH